MLYKSVPGALAMRLGRRCCACLWLLVAHVLFTAQALAQNETVERYDSSAAQKVFHFVIPAQDLSAALQRFSQISGMAVLVDQEVIQGYRSAGLNGNYSPKEGLNRLLAGSGLMAQYTGNGFTVKPASLGNNSEGKALGKGTSLNAISFATALQQALKQTLCASVVTRPGDYRAALQLWIDSLGRVAHSRLLASTGSLSRDAALIEGLRELSVGQAPPSALRQPVTVLVVPENSAGGMDCKT